MTMCKGHLKLLMSLLDDMPHQLNVNLRVGTVMCWSLRGVGVGDERPGLETPATNWRRRARRLAGNSVATGDREQ